jgi:Ca2+-binding EF-hand superfamily protein
MGKKKSGSSLSDPFGLGASATGAGSAGAATPRDDGLAPERCALESSSEPRGEAMSVSDLREAIASVSERVVDLFRAWDEDKSGRVDRKEFHRGCHALGLAVDRGATDAVFESLDVDCSGTLEYKELHTKLRKGAELQHKFEATHAAARFETDTSLYTDEHAGNRHVEVAVGLEKRRQAADRSKDGSGFDWDTFSRVLPTGDDVAAAAARKKLWGTFDGNGNGLISYSEVETGLNTAFAGSPTVAPVLARAKLAVSRAFHAAKGADQSRGARYRKASTATNQFAGHNQDEFISPSEFKTLLRLLRQYLELWLMFDAVDTGGLNYSSGNTISHIGANLGDNRISIAEFTHAIPLIERWGSTDGRPALVIGDTRDAAAAAFAEIDADGSGAIRFDEFARWAIRKRLDLDDDDDDVEPQHELM